MNFENYLEKYIKPLSIENLLISLKNIPISLFENYENNLNCINLISKILFLYRNIVSETLIINIEFNKNLPTNCSFYQMFYSFFYSLINYFYNQNQKIILRFPQIFGEKFSNIKTYELIIYNLLSNKLITKNKEFNLDYNNISLELININQNILKNINKSLLLTNNIFSYKYICFAGTFDYLHIGHNILIQMSLLLSNNKIGIGICSDEMIKKKSPPFLLESANERLNHMKNFVEINGINNNQNIFYKIITDPIDFAGIDCDLEALVLTEETFKGGEMVNEIRIKNNLKKIDLICLNVIQNNKNRNNNIYNTDNLNNQSISIKSIKVSSSFIRNEILSKISLNELEIVYNKWKYLIQEILKINNEIFLNYWWNKILTNYMKKYKYYHTLKHILSCLNLYENNKDLINENSQKEFLIALWFHDIIYYPGNPNNEKKSAQIAIKFCNEIENSNLNLNKIKNYIIETSNHIIDNKSYSEDNSINLFLDIDMSVVGQDDYKQYEIDIKYEYLNVYDIDEYYIGRIEFLKTLLNKKKIFRTERFYELYENNARNNIQMGINLLLEEHYKQQEKQQKI
jgi:predicted metal-dependent HD superfamily phosphohydrolase/phosphopantetheine adenylyltransferase